jgi:hypothetical protein
MAAGIVLLDQHRLHSREAHVKRGRASVDAATDDDGIRKFPSSAHYRLDVGLCLRHRRQLRSVIGFTGARSR